MTQSTTNPFEEMSDRELFALPVDQHTEESIPVVKARILGLCEKYRAEWDLAKEAAANGEKPKRTRKKATEGESTGGSILDRKIAF